MHKIYLIKIYSFLGIYFETLEIRVLLVTSCQKKNVYVLLTLSVETENLSCLYLHL